MAANRLHGSIEALAEAAERYLATIIGRAPHPAPAPGTDREPPVDAVAA